MRFTNILSEEYLLGAVMIDPETNIMFLRGEGITSEYFTTNDNKRVWTLAGGFYDSSQIGSIELMDVEPEILGAHGGRELAVHIANIRRQCRGCARLPQHVATLKGYKSLRMTYSASQEAIAMIEAGDSAESVIIHLQDKASEASMTLNTAKPWKDSEEIANEMIEIVEKAQNPSVQVGFPSGVHLIDHHTGGLEPGQFWVVAAPSSCGKTMLMMQIANSFLRSGKHVLVFSFETSAGKLGMRNASNSQNICGNAMLGKGGDKMDHGDNMKFKRAITDLREANNLTICDNFDLTLDSMMAIATMRAKQGFPIDLIEVDYIQLVPLNDTKGKSREQQVAEISRGLKKMAKQHHCPVISASQLNEDGKTRESRAILQDADVLLNIDPNETNPRIYIAKNRDGDRGDALPLRMIGAYQRFEEYTPAKKN